MPTDPHSALGGPPTKSGVPYTSEDGDPLSACTPTAPGFRRNAIDNNKFK